MKRTLLLKVLLPFFPDNVWLRKYWWHRFAIVIGLFFSVSFSLIGILLLYLFVTVSNFNFPQPTPVSVGQTISADQFNKLYRVRDAQFDPIKEGATPVNDAPNIIWFDLEAGIIFLFLANLIPNGIYHLILFVTTDTRWKNNK